VSENQNVKEAKPSKKLSLEEIINTGRQKLIEFVGLKPLAVVEVLPGEDNSWLLKVEFIEREAIPNTMDMIGLYEAQLDNHGQILGYSRKDMRKRGDSYQ
jgi:hypothetical protein